MRERKVLLLFFFPKITKITFVNIEIRDASKLCEVRFLEFEPREKRKLNYKYLEKKIN
jgi:hypothetical protein